MSDCLKSCLGSHVSITLILPNVCLSVSLSLTHMHTHKYKCHSVGCFQLSTLQTNHEVVKLVCHCPKPMGELVNVPQTQVLLNNPTPILTFCGRHAYMDKSPTHLEA